MNDWTPELRKQLHRCTTRLTNANCRRQPEAIAKDYAKFAVEHGLDTVSVFPSTIYGRKVQDRVRTALLESRPCPTLVEVSEEDYT